MLTAEGRTGIITVDESFITIERKGAMAKMTHGFTQGQKRIAISQVTSVQFKKPGLAVGYIQFSMAGANESKGGAFKAVKDENSVAFEKFLPDFEAIRDFVEAKIAERFTRSAEPPTAAPQQSSVSDQIRELAALRDDGLLTEEEFASQKARLLKDRVAGPSESNRPSSYVNDAVASLPKQRRSNWKIAALALAVALVLWLVVGAMWLYLEPSPTAAAPARPPTQTTPAPPAAKPEPGPSLTTSQRNAIKKAKSYLDFTAFSRSGLIEQLEYNGYSTADATYAVNSINVNWNEQAAKKAKSYLDFTAFSRSGLIEQLEYNGFTTAQAEYGVSKVGY